MTGLIHKIEELHLEYSGTNERRLNGGVKGEVFMEEWDPHRHSEYMVGSLFWKESISRTRPRFDL